MASLARIDSHHRHSTKEDPPQPSLNLEKLQSALKVTIEPVQVLKLESELSQRELERHQLEKMQNETEKLLIYTKAVKWPKMQESLTERRFIIRVIQLLFGLGAFLDIGYTSIINSYTSVVLEASGIPFFCFVSITSIFVSISNMFLYTFPGFLAIPPHRHYRVSKVELTFDLLTATAWFVASTQIVIYAECPQQTLQVIGNIATYLNISTKYCPTLLVAMALAYSTGLLFLWKAIEGFRDQAKKDDSAKPGKHIMFARGSWKD
ncbi:hypothetical protein HDU91_001868 [Kappamyces sp. JEL0680]|nr:hypothetical protein HDU91_001868 [Kappamyces sp. JEL0680]